MWRPPFTPASCLGRRGSAYNCSCETDKVAVSVLYYNSPTALRKHAAIWDAFPLGLKDKFEFIIVDDASTVPAARILENYSFINVFSIHPPKLDWNIGGGRNLAMHAARSCWVTLMDVDYAMNASLAAKVASIDKTNAANIYKFRRDNPRKRVHPAIALMHKRTYWHAGGCDEDFVGHYGMTDPHFWHRVSQNRKNIAILTPEWPIMQYITASRVGAQLIKEPNRNRVLFTKKRQGKLAWSNSYLRFNFCTSSLM